MKDLMQFVLTIIELTSIMLLWGSLGLKKEKDGIKKTIVIVATSILVIVMNKSIPAVGNIVNYILFMIFMKILFNKKASEIFTEFCIVISMGIAIQLVLMVVFIGLKRISGPWDYYREGMFINISFLLISIGVYYLIPVKKYYDRYNQAIKKTYVFLTILLAYVISIKIIWDYNHDYILNGLVFFAIATSAFIAINVIYFIKDFKLEEQRKIIENHNKYNIIISNIMGEVRRRQHDFKNHLNTLYGLAEVTEGEELREEIKSYIKSLNSSLRDVDRIIHIKNSIISAVIYSKQNKAEDKKINFIYNIREADIEFPLEDYELSEILNNLLDNAFEAVEVSQGKSREVYLEIGSEEGRKYIEVGNSGEYIAPENIEKLFTKGYTTKKEDGHGYGLYNVKRIVESRNGRILLSSEGGLTVFKILF